ncbi:hypothetical protein AVEN_89076-1 [Araneus ventricosus]|uniref:Uncharacterized protein n=1 Tax=Araneus ventricosus TaxID=182803 RepID=A0A4Y2B211_ARAVE|nr:hypothetical protein AVEN_89076-1 [Araneus ventricosus]
MEDGIYRKRGTSNTFLRTDEPIFKSTFYAKRQLPESQHAADDNMSSTYKTSPHIDEDINFKDLEFDCINVESTDNEDNDTNQNDEVKVNLEKLNEPLYPSSCLNIDEIPMYRKSNYHVWPIQCMINELPPNERKDHILMCGLWFGPHKTNMNDFSKPFVTELSNLSQSGFKWIDATNSK